MVLLVAAVSLCLTIAAVAVGCYRYAKIQLKVNKKIGHDLGCTTALLMNEDAVVDYFDRVWQIYENAPAEIRDEAVCTKKGKELDHSVMGGEYEALFEPVITPEFLEIQNRLKVMAEEIQAVDVTVFVADLERKRVVYVFSGYGDEKYAEVYSPPGFWSNINEDVYNYFKSLDAENKGIHARYDKYVGKDVMASMMPFCDKDTGEVIAYVCITREWTYLQGEQIEYLKGLFLAMGTITVLLLLISHVLFRHAIMNPLRSLSTEQARMSTELEMAANIQLSLLPGKNEILPEAGNCRIYGILKPAKEVGGDFYDYFWIDEGHVGIVIGDAAGKGVPASLFSMVAKTAVKMSTTNGSGPAVALEQANQILCENNRETMFATAWVGIYSISERRLVYANAGHEDPILYRKGEDGIGKWSITSEDHDMVLGIMEGLPYRENEMMLAPGERILIFTDGVPEAQDRAQTLYGEKRLLACLNSIDAEGEEILNGVFADIDRFEGDAAQFDDMTMVLLEIE